MYIKTPLVNFFEERKMVDAAPGVDDQVWKLHQISQQKVREEENKQKQKQKDNDKKGVNTQGK